MYCILMYCTAYARYDVLYIDVLYCICKICFVDSFVKFACFVCEKPFVMLKYCLMLFT